MIDWPIIMGDRWAAVTAAQTAPLCITCVIDSNPDKGEGGGGGYLYYIYIKRY